MSTEISPMTTRTARRTILAGIFGLTSAAVAAPVAAQRIDPPPTGTAAPPKGFGVHLVAPAHYDVATALDNRQRLFDAYSAVLAGNHDALFDLCAPDVVHLLPASLPYGGTRTGVAGARTGVAAAFGAWRDVRCDIQEFVPAGDIVIAYMHVALTSRATGAVYEGPTAETFHFRDGRIAEWRVILWDTHRVRQVLGVA